MPGRGGEDPCGLHFWQPAPIRLAYTEMTTNGLAEVPLDAERCSNCGGLRVTDDQLEQAEKRMRFKGIMTPALLKKKER